MFRLRFIAARQLAGLYKVASVHIFMLNTGYLVAMAQADYIEQD
jgi:hypothetical protein